MSITFDVRQKFQWNGNIQSFHLFELKLHLLSFSYTGADSSDEAFQLRSLYIDENLVLFAARMKATYLSFYRKLEAV
jgi:hypothetical protein